MVQGSTVMRAEIERWLRRTVTAPSVWALKSEIPGCERLLRDHGIHAIPPSVLPGIVGDARIDGLLADWLNEHRPKEIRNRDQEREHDLRDHLARIGVPVRPYKGPRPPRSKSNAK